MYRRNPNYFYISAVPEPEVVDMFDVIFNRGLITVTPALADALNLAHIPSDDGINVLVRAMDLLEIPANLPLLALREMPWQDAANLANLAAFRIQQLPAALQPEAAIAFNQALTGIR